MPVTREILNNPDMFFDFTNDFEETTRWLSLEAIKKLADPKWERALLSLIKREEAEVA